ncbi:MAG: hypothetical protein JOZ38_00865 [Candidatus Eremiobacteraeota bacterium]|nr:hypothetical protein [Candidatus Eremiobacteraeota bacterium]
MTYPEAVVAEILSRFSIPLQYNNQEESAKAVVARYHHVWTPDLRVLAGDGSELYRWNGFLPPFEFAAQALAAFAHARLRMLDYAGAEETYQEVLRRFPTAHVAPEATYFLGVSQYRKDPDSNDLRKQWHHLQGRYPQSEWRIKQSFIEQ